MERFNRVLKLFLVQKLILDKTFLETNFYPIHTADSVYQEILIKPETGRMSIIRREMAQDERTVVSRDSIQWNWKDDMLSFQGGTRMSEDRKIVVLENFSQLLTEEGYFSQSTVRDIELTREELNEIFRNISTLMNRCTKIIGDKIETYKPDPKILQLQELAGIKPLW